LRSGSLILLFCVALLSLFSSPAAFAGAYEDGLKAYSGKNYKDACLHFEQAIRQSPQDVNAYYYDALSWHQLKQWTTAAQRYRELVERFPDSSAALKARDVLRTLDPNFAAAMYGIQPGGNSSHAVSPGRSGNDEDNGELASSATSTKLYYRLPHDGQGGTAFIVRAQINGRPIDMNFDTGASTIALGKNHLAQLGLPPIPHNQEPSGFSSGVGSAGLNKIWDIRADLKLGDFVIKNCPMMVQEYLSGDPLLGQTAFKHFAYTIDYGSKSITLTRKDAYTASTGPAGAYSVPFAREGNELVVDAVINGRAYKCYFDTGAMHTAFSARDMVKLGIEIPDDAQPARFSGVSGSTAGAIFPIQSMKVGPIERRHFEIAVLQSANMGRPLLGQNFYEGWQYTVDNAANVIRFVRR
jgi:clan AA aspartic protease (TIGR02281 family)